MSIYKGNNLLAGLPDISGKANVSLDNLTDAGNIVAAKASMPSSVYDNITIAASGTGYSAPSDGWFVAYGHQSGNNGYILFTSDSGLQCVCQPTGTNNYAMRVYIPARKSDTIYLAYGNATIETYKFVYAEGSKSEA